MSASARSSAVLGVLGAALLAAPLAAGAPGLRRESQLLAPDGADADLFGSSVAVDGGTAVVGAPWASSNAGAAYVYTRTVTGWVVQQKLTPSDLASGGYFGQSVAISGDRLVVGAFNAFTPTTAYGGAAYVFARVNGTWVPDAKLVAPDGDSPDRFGLSVAISGNTTAVGAPWDDHGAGVDAGSVYVFVLQGGTTSWALQQKLTASDAAPSNAFGSAVALEGDTLAAGAPSLGNGSGTAPGAAYVFQRSGSAWTEQGRLTVPGGAGGDGLGASVALSADTVVAGIPWADAGLGAAIVYTRSAGAWSQQARLTAAGAGDFFGLGVAVSGDLALVGAPMDTYLGGGEAGSVFAFRRADGAWTQQARLSAPGTSFLSHLGSTVALAGGTAVAGAPDGRNGAGVRVGSAQAFRLFSKGDFDGDGQTDLLVRQAATGQTEAWLMNGVTRPGAPAALSPTPASLDWSVAATDDFDRDGRNDLLLWSSATGAAEFWLMNGTARVGAAVPLAGALAPPWKPAAVADFDRDGRPDLVYRNHATQKISVWLMNGTAFVAARTPNPDQAVDANWEIVGAQDWNGDGDTDFLWYNPSSGKIVLWFMDGALARLSGQFTEPPNAGASNWKVLAMGDYGVGAGGEAGSIDLVWRNATSGRFVAWYMDHAGRRTTGTFTSPDAPGPDPTAWTIVGPR